MTEEHIYSIDFIDAEFDFDFMPTITRYFVKEGISLQWYEDDSKGNQVSNNGNQLVYLHLIFKRVFKYAMVFEVIDGRLRIPKGSLEIRQKDFLDIMIGFVNLIQGHVKVIQKSDDSEFFAYEYNNGSKVYDYNEKSFSESTLLMLIDYSLAELQEALTNGDSEKVEEIKKSLEHYKLELSRF